MLGELISWLMDEVPAVDTYLMFPRQEVAWCPSLAWLFIETDERGEEGRGERRGGEERRREEEEKRGGLRRGGGGGGGGEERRGEKKRGEERRGVLRQQGKRE